MREFFCPASEKGTIIFAARKLFIFHIRKSLLPSVALAGA